MLQVIQRFRPLISSAADAIYKHLLDARPADRPRKLTIKKPKLEILPQKIESLEAARPGPPGPLDSNRAPGYNYACHFPS
jgi:hypothetical protein